VQLSLWHATPVFVLGVSETVAVQQIAGSPVTADASAGRSAIVGMRGNVQDFDATTVIDATQNCAGQLSRFFPDVVPLRVPVQVTAVPAGKSRLREATVLEFGGAEHAIFLSTLPLEFADRVSVASRNNSETAEASVVAVQYHEGRKAVAVRFLHGPCDWVKQTR
jgi:hypothetical protein